MDCRRTCSSSSSNNIFFCIPIRPAVLTLAVLWMILVSCVGISRLIGIGTRTPAPDIDHLDPDRKARVQALWSIAAACNLVGLAVSLVDLCLCILLIKGLRDRAPRTLQTWVTANLIILVFSGLLLTILGKIGFDLAGATVSSDLRYSAIRSLLMSLFVYACWIFAVWKYAGIMEKETAVACTSAGTVECAV